MMHYEISAGWGREAERFEADQEPRFATRWHQVRLLRDAGAWIVTNEGQRIGTVLPNDPLTQPGLFRCTCINCSHTFWSRRCGESLCFACAICVRPAEKHVPLRDEWRCYGLGAGSEHQFDDRGICYGCGRSKADITAAIEKANRGRQQHQPEGHEDTRPRSDAQ